MRSSRPTRPRSGRFWISGERIGCTVLGCCGRDLLWMKLGEFFGSSGWVECLRMFSGCVCLLDILAFYGVWAELEIPRRFLFLIVETFARTCLFITVNSLPIHSCSTIIARWNTRYIVSPATGDASTPRLATPTSRQLPPLQWMSHPSQSNSPDGPPSTITSSKTSSSTSRPSSSIPLLKSAIHGQGPSTRVQTSWAPSGLSSKSVKDRWFVSAGSRCSRHSHHLQPNQIPSLELVRHFYALYARHEELGKHPITTYYEISDITLSWKDRYTKNLPPNNPIPHNFRRFALHAGLLAITVKSRRILIFDITKQPIRYIFRIETPTDPICYALNSTYLVVVDERNIWIMKMMGRFTARPWIEKAYMFPLPVGASTPVSVTLAPQTQTPYHPLIALTCAKEIHIIHPRYYTQPQTSASLPRSLITIPLPPPLLKTLAKSATHAPRFNLTGGHNIVHSTHIFGTTTEPPEFPPPSPNTYFDTLRTSSEQKLQLFPARRPQYGETLRFLHPFHLFEDYYIVTCPLHRDVRIIALEGEVETDPEDDTISYIQKPSTRMILFPLPPRSKHHKNSHDEPVCLYHIHVRLLILP